MKKLLYVIVFICSYTNLSSQEIGFFSVGVDINEKDFLFLDHEINQNGFYCDFMIPIINKSFILGFSVQFTDHKIQSSYKYYMLRCYSKKDYYVTGLNEILIGKKFGCECNRYIISMIGIGVYARCIYHPGPGDIAAYVASSFNTYIMKKFNKADIGISININYLPVDGYFDTANDFMFQLGIAVAK